MNDRFLKDGFFQIERSFSLSELEEIKAAFRGLTEHPVDGVGIIREESSPSVRSIMGWQRVPGILMNFATDERVLDPVRTVLGNRVEFHQTKYNPKAGNSRGEKWDPHRGDTFWCWKDGVPASKGLLSVFIALTDQTEENGAVYAWKGSHAITLEQIRPFMLGLEETADQTTKDTAADLSLQISPEKLEDIDRNFERVMLTGPAGTAWVLDAGLLHASQANRSNKVRELVANVFRAEGNAPLRPRPQNYLCEPTGNWL